MNPDWGLLRWPGHGIWPWTWQLDVEEVLLVLREEVWACCCTGGKDWLLGVTKGQAVHMPQDTRTETEKKRF